MATPLLVKESDPFIDTVDIGVRVVSVPLEGWFARCIPVACV